VLALKEGGGGAEEERAQAGTSSPPTADIEKGSEHTLAALGKGIAEKNGGDGDERG